MKGFPTNPVKLSGNFMQKWESDQLTTRSGTPHSVSIVCLVHNTRHFSYKSDELTKAMLKYINYTVVSIQLHWSIWYDGLIDHVNFRSFQFVIVCTFSPCQKRHHSRSWKQVGRPEIMNGNNFTGDGTYLYYGLSCEAGDESVAIPGG